LLYLNWVRTESWFVIFVWFVDLILLYKMFCYLLIQCLVKSYLLGTTDYFHDCNSNYWWNMMNEMNDIWPCIWCKQCEHLFDYVIVKFTCIIILLVKQCIFVLILIVIICIWNLLMMFTHGHMTASTHNCTFILKLCMALVSSYSWIEWCSVSSVFLNFTKYI